MVRNLIKGLDIIAQALMNDNEIPREAFELTSKSFIPSSLYRILGNLGWRMQARRYGTKKKLNDQPYASPYEQ